MASAQAVQAPDPTAVLYVPSGHFWQPSNPKATPAAEENVPIGQSVSAPPASEYFPAATVSQPPASSTLVALAFTFLPLAQAVQDAYPAIAQEPSGHVSQFAAASAPTTLLPYFPATQSVGDAAFPTVDHFPRGAKQIVAALAVNPDLTLAKLAAVQASHALVPSSAPAVIVMNADVAQ